MEGIINARDLPEDERIHLKKSFDGWRVVYPFKNEDGTLNFFNLLTGGSYWNLLKVGMLLFLILGLTYGYLHDMNACNDFTERIQSNPGKFCMELLSKQAASFEIGEINFTILNEAVLNITE